MRKEVRLQSRLDDVERRCDYGSAHASEPAGGRQRLRERKRRREEDVPACYQMDAPGRSCSLCCAAGCV